jgi:histidinol phosphatase-like enzyme
MHPRPRLIRAVFFDRDGTLMEETRYGATVIPAHSIIHRARSRA